MTLRSKIFLPLALISIMFLLFLYGYWFPHSLYNLEHEEVLSTERHLDTVAEGLVPLLLAHQLDAVYENLDALLKQNKEWVSIQLLDPDDRLIYPFEVPTTPLKKNFRTVKHQLQFLGNDLGKLVLTIDTSSRMIAVGKKHQQLVTALLVVFCGYLVSIGFIVERVVSRPVNHLAHAAEQMACGDFDVPMVKTGDDEVGSLVDSFTRMRDSIRDYQASLLTSSLAITRLSQAVEQSPVSIMITDTDGRLTFVNRRFSQMTGYEPEEVMGKNPRFLKSDTTAAAEYRTLWQTVTSGGIWCGELCNKKKDGELFWESASISPIIDESGTVVSYLAVKEDITDRKKAEAEIHHLKNYLSNIIDSMPSVLVGMDQEENVTQWNRQAELVTGIQTADAVGHPISQVLSEFSPWIEAMRSEIKQRRPATIEKLLLERQGERCFYDVMLYPLVSNGIEGTVIRVEDVTERTRIQEMMIQTEKMMSIGGLAAGMAHEINNPLGIISQAAQNIVRRIDPEFPANQQVAKELGFSLEAMQTYFDKRQIPAFIASIREASSRAAKIITNILRFSRRTDATMHPASLSEVMEQALELAANDYDLKKRFDFRSIEIVREYETTLPPVLMVAVEIEQVLLNLLKNAAQAMMSNPLVQKQRIVLRLKQESGYAVIDVEDNGPGMAEEVRRRVFEPFFTTKEPGIGTGLGLSVSYMIVTKNHKGLMEVVSEPGKGARFTIRLPLHDEKIYV